MIRFLLLVVALLAVEIPIFRAGARVVGAGWAWFLLLATAVGGVWVVVRGAGLRSERQRSRLTPAEVLLEPVGHWICGFLLFVPGFFTDAIGILLLLVGPLRRAAALAALRYVGRQVTRGGARGEIHFAFRSADGPPGGEDRPEAGDADEPPPSGEPPPSSVHDVPFEVVERDPPAGDR